MLIEGLVRLVKESELYIDQLMTESPIQIGFKLLDTNEEASLIIQDKITVQEDTENSIGILTMQSSTFNKILKRKADFAALIGRSRMSDIRPINYEIKIPERFAEAFEVVKALMNVFFIPGRVKIRDLRKELAGSAHGAHPIPIAYWNGLRYAWYHVPAGEVLNRDEEKDPYPQVFIILKGHGYLELEEESLVLELGKAYYIPPNGIHKLHAETDIEMTWLAWDTPP
jgi:mannose-6-phosphate isomerase-like protein (cupin superfamily)